VRTLPNQGRRMSVSVRRPPLAWLWCSSSLTALEDKERRHETNSTTYVFEVIHNRDMPKSTFSQASSILGLLDRVYRHCVRDCLDQPRVATGCQYSETTKATEQRKENNAVRLPDFRTHRPTHALSHPALATLLGPDLRKCLDQVCRELFLPEVAAGLDDA
jgi:hypothetical protein